MDEPQGEGQSILRVPELDLAGVKVFASAWLKRVGVEVVEGERLLELVAGEVTVDLSSPRSGRLSHRLVEEDQEVHPGQAVALIQFRSRGEVHP